MDRKQDGDSRREFGKKMLAGAIGGIFAGSALSAGARENGRGIQIFGEEGEGKKEGAEKHVCKGLNSCKGKGGCKTDDHECGGKNACKGKGGCPTVEKHECKGKNECKGHGGCASGDNKCAGKNSCKGKGGCKVPVKEDLRKKLHDAKTKEGEKE